MHSTSSPSPLLHPRSSLAPFSLLRYYVHARAFPSFVRVPLGTQATATANAAATTDPTITIRRGHHHPLPPPPPPPPSPLPPPPPPPPRPPPTDATKAPRTAVKCSTLTFGSLATRWNGSHTTMVRRWCYFLHSTFKFTTKQNPPMYQRHSPLAPVATTDHDVTCRRPKELR